MILAGVLLGCIKRIIGVGVVSSCGGLRILERFLKHSRGESSDLNGPVRLRLGFSGGKFERSAKNLRF